MSMRLDKRPDSRGVVKDFPLSSPLARKSRPNLNRRFSRKTREKGGTGEAKSGVARAIKRGIKTQAIYGPSASRGIIVIGDILWRRGATRSQLAEAIKELRRASYVRGYLPLILNSAVDRPGSRQAVHNPKESRRIAVYRAFVRYIRIYFFFCFAKHSNLSNYSISLVMEFIWDKLFEIRSK